ncbi:helix-turn-helix domain-containing protein [bacterium]|nr:helix-turn-helix domain-containing protein [bacterium]
MKHISILIPKGQFSIVNIAGAYQIFNWANDMFFDHSRKHLFEVEFVGYQKPANDAEGYYTITPGKTLHEIAKTDIIIIPAVHGDLKTSIENNREMTQWVAAQHANGAEIATFCIGAFLLADTGILNGKTCSTHWGHAKELQEMFPEIKVQAENIVTACDGIYSSGGAYAFTNLIIYLIERYGGRELAIMTAKAFMIDIDKNSQSVFMMFNGQKDHGDALVLKVQNYIESAYSDALSVAELASHNATNRRTLERRFKSATGNSIIEYLQRVRVEKAKEILEKPHQTVSEAMYQTGYNDSKAFREVFKKLVGLSPFDYKKKFVRAEVV